MDLSEKILKKTDVLNGRILNVHVDTVELPNGKQSTREIVSHPGGVCICALTNNNELLFVRQFRYAFKDTLLELPAGTLIPGNDPLSEGIRELKEETGAIGYDYMSLGKLYPSPGYCEEIIYLYFCRVKEFGSTNFDEDEFITTEKISIDKALDMVLNGEISDAKSQVAILKTYFLIKNNKISLN